MERPSSPFGLESIQRVPLDKPPLEQVICQVQFPQILAIRNEDAVIPFQEALRHQYPVLRKEQTRDVQISEAGVKVSDSGFVWRLHDDVGAYQVSLAPGFVSLAVQRYESRAEFTDRVREALDALDAAFAPATFDRIGVRYIDRVTGSILDDLAAYVRPELLGVAGSGTLGSDYIRSIGEASGLIQGRIQQRARWGVISPGDAVDPRSLPPIDVASWFLDVDTFSDDGGSFDVGSIVDETEKYSVAAYQFFRWSVRDEFLRYFGGEL